MGLNPINSSGEYFRNNIWYWSPLWSYCRSVAPDICESVEHGYSNDGDGLDDEDCVALATKLEDSISSGFFQDYKNQFEFEKINASKDSCYSCKGVGHHSKGVIVQGDEMVENCRSCKGTGLVDSSRSMRMFEIENVREFIDFLKNCGGFQIW